MVIYMVLGSCVAVILYDREVKKSACCHYILPRMPEDTSPMPIYGTVAVLGLIRLFLEDGTLIENLEAQVIGGSDLPGRSVGRENVEIAMKILAKKDVHITSSDVGGEKGRKVIYNSESNHLAVIKVEKIRAEDWYPDEGNT
ncbi:chemotaxis protein CheD [bacterium]|nr:chemotaxis protein CheD [bacterium]